LSLRGAPLLYVFYETSQIGRQRELFESVIGVPVIEVEPHLPHHRHGVFKYDAGGIILSHNMTGPSRFRREESDGLVTLFGVPTTWSFDRLYAGEMAIRNTAGLATDEEGRHFGFLPSPGLTRTIVEELQLVTPNLDTSVAFYRDVLDLALLERTSGEARFATGTVPIRLVSGRTAPDGGSLRHDTYLLVFHTATIQETRNALMDRGLEFKGPRVGYSEIGGTIRFDDPSGHRFCLYVPSEESLTWGSGSKVIAIAGGQAVPR
jgi:catechol 2,3-dioxygenase-like lactoylglutathione lyase family enzyme